MEFIEGLKGQPFGYYGGKQRMVSKILPLIPKHTVYIEPFFGGGSVFFRKPYPAISNNSHYREVINDFDERAVNFFRVLQDKNKFEILQHKLFHTPYSQEEYSIASRILKGLVESDDIGKAWAWFVQCQMSFSYKIFGGWGTNTHTTDLAKTWCNKLDLKRFCDRLMSTYICCGDAIDCLKKFNSPQSFAYIDPPYIGTSCGHYTGYTEDQYKMLLDFLDHEFEGSFILSGYNTELANNYGWEKVEFKAINSSSGSVNVDKSVKHVRTNTERTEVLWVRGNTKPVREDIQKCYDSDKFDCFN